MRFAVTAVLAAGAAIVGWLSRPLRSDPRERADLVAAVEAVDRELAANLELTSMFDQTKQAVVLENGAYARYRETLERSSASAASSLTSLYERMPEAETAMERRGPANSLRTEDRALIEGWEGDARAAQRGLRALLEPTRAIGWRALSARLGGRRARR
jgi:hypothetical protein